VKRIKTVSGNTTIWDLILGTDVNSDVTVNEEVHALALVA